MKETQKAIQERIHERAAAIQAARASGEGWWASLRALLSPSSFRKAVEEELEVRSEEEEWRAAQDPLRWATWSDFAAARRRLGLPRPPKRHPNYPRSWLRRRRVRSADIGRRRDAAVDPYPGAREWGG